MITETENVLTGNSANTLIQRLYLEPEDTDLLLLLCGSFDEHLRYIEERLDVKILNRGYLFNISSDSQEKSEKAVAVLRYIYQILPDYPDFDITQLHLCLQAANLDAINSNLTTSQFTGVSTTSTTTSSSKSAEIPSASTVKESSTLAKSHKKGNPTQKIRNDNLSVIQTPNLRVCTRGKNQHSYIERIRSYDLIFGIGPAGTGKTYLAVACAVEAFQSGAIDRIVLVRPAVEAGEKLGFLPGDLSQKIDPYLKPLYDALHEMLGVDLTNRLIENDSIEIAPLAFMRGRTLSRSFIIMDEGQNTTVEQMKMFLTRIGFGSKAVITGDLTQIDLPFVKESGLSHAVNVLSSLNDIAFVRFSSDDVVRHALVRKIVDAYVAYDAV